MLEYYTPMSFRDSLFGRWRWLPVITLLFACVGLTVLVVRYYCAHSQAPPGVVETERRKAQPTTDTNRFLINLPATNKLESGEDRVVALVTEGNQLLERGNYAAAVEKFEQAVRMDSNSEDVHYNLAIALAKLGKTEEAKKQYTEALRIFPEYGEAHNNLGNLLMNENKVEEAIEHFREATKIAPDNASFHNNLGTAFGRQGKAEEARAEFAEAVKLSPTYVEARVNLGNACLSAGHVEEALVQLNEALRLRPDFPPAIRAMQRARQREASSNMPR